MDSLSLEHWLFSAATESWMLYTLLVSSLLVFYLPKIIGAMLMFFGSFFIISGSLGLLKLKDVYSKIHAVGVTDVMGATMMIAGLILLIPWSIVSVKMLAIVLLFWLISPLTAHILARFAMFRKQDKIELKKVSDIYIDSVRGSAQQKDVKITTDTGVIDRKHLK